MFNTREIAIIIWLGVSLICVRFKTKDKSAFKALITAFFHYKIVISYLLGVLYTLCGVWVLFYFDLWTKNEIKDTVLWCVFAVFSTMLGLQKVSENKNYFKEAVKEIFKFTLIIEFITGLYTFSLVAELILVPVTTIIVLLQVFSERDKNQEVVNKFLKNLLGLAGLITIGYTIHKIGINIKEFASFDTLRNFILSPFLALWFLPFLYLMSLYMTYEQYNIALSYKFDNKELLKFAKLQAVLKFNIDVRSFDRWKSTFSRETLITKEDILNSIKELKRLQKVERNPPVIDEKTGWSPYKAKDYLIPKGLSTRYYTKGYVDIWSASSNYKKLDEELSGNTVTYSIEGSETTAKNLSLYLNINDSAGSKEAIKVFFDYASFLCDCALNDSIPKKIENALLNGKDLCIRHGKVEMIVGKDDWDNQGKYRLSFVIKRE